MVIIMNNYDWNLYHSGVLGQKWGIRRYQNEDGTLTALGKQRYAKDSNYSKHQQKQLRSMQDNIRKSRIKNAAITVAGTTAVAAALTATGMIGVATLITASTASTISATTGVVNETKKLRSLQQKIENGNEAIKYAMNHNDTTLTKARSNAYFKAKYE